MRQYDFSCGNFFLHYARKDKTRPASPNERTNSQLCFHLIREDASSISSMKHTKRTYRIRRYHFLPSELDRSTQIQACQQSRTDSGPRDWDYRPITSQHVHQHRQRSSEWWREYVSQDDGPARLRESQRTSLFQICCGCCTPTTHWHIWFIWI